MIIQNEAYIIIKQQAMFVIVQMYYSQDYHIKKRYFY